VAGLFSNQSREDCPDPELKNPVSYEEPELDFRISIDTNEWAFLVTSPSQIDSLRPKSGDDVKRLEIGNTGREFLRGVDFTDNYVLAVRIWGWGSGADGLQIIGIDKETSSRIHAYTCHQDTGVDDSAVPLTRLAVIPIDGEVPNTVTVTSFSRGKEDADEYTRSNASVSDILSTE